MFMWIKMTERLERLKNTVNKYMADIRPDRLTTCQSERKSVVRRRPSALQSLVQSSSSSAHRKNFGNDKRLRLVDIGQRELGWNTTGGSL
jgi:hypothetical protein